MKEFATFLSQFPAGFWVVLIIALVGTLWFMFGVKEAPEGEETETGFKTYEQLWHESERRCKWLEESNQTKYDEGYEAGLDKKLSAYLEENHKQLPVIVD